MRRLARLLDALEGPDADEDALSLLGRYLDEAPPADAAWGIALIAGRGIGRCASRAVVREAAIEASGLPPWLFDACVDAAGHLADAVAHAVESPADTRPLGLAAWIEQRLQPLRGLPPNQRVPVLAAWLREADPQERHLLVRLIGAQTVRLPVAWLRRALALRCGVDERRIASRLLSWSSGDANPDAAGLAALLAREPSPEDAAAPLPLAGPPLIVTAEAFAADAGPWLAQYVRGGRHVQLVRSRDRIRLWSAEGEPIADRMPGVLAAARDLAETTVIEGEWRASAGGVAERFVARDLLMVGGRDVRAWPAQRRLAELAATIGDRFPIDDAAAAADVGNLQDRWARCRVVGAEGLLLHRADEAYGIAPRFWPAEPLAIVAVLVHVRREAERRTGQRVVCGFALRGPEASDPDSHRPQSDRTHAGAWMPVADIAVYPGDAAYARIEAVTRDHTVGRVGPVRLLRPVLVAELAFDSVQTRVRRRSGVALRGVRLLRVLEHAEVADVHTLQRLADLVTTGESR